MAVIDAPRQRSALDSTVGKKALMAGTGLILLLFLLVHALGNLKIFFGPKDFDHYAHWLRTIGEPLLPHTWYLWIQRGVLTVAAIAHIWAATSLALRSRAARPVKYAHRKPVQGSYAARTMRWGGVIILLFVIWHILDLSIGTLNPHDKRGQVYANVVSDFSPHRWYITIWYALAMLAVGFHIRHGAYSAARTLGQRSAKGEVVAKRVGLGLAVLITSCFLIVPFAVTFGLVS